MRVVCTIVKMRNPYSIDHGDKLSWECCNSWILTTLVKRTLTLTGFGTRYELFVGITYFQVSECVGIFGRRLIASRHRSQIVTPAFMFAKPHFGAKFSVVITHLM